MWLLLQTILLNLMFFLLFSVVFFLLIPALIVIGLVLAPFGTPRHFFARARFLVKVFGRVVTVLGEPFVSVRLDSIPDNFSLPCIYVSNHRSAVDGFTMSHLPGEGVQVANLWPFKIPVLGFFARLTGYLSIREMNPEEFSARGTALLKQGVSIVSFPEGTRSVGRELGAFHGSIFRLAQETGAPVVPLCLSGSDKILPKGSHTLRPGRVRMRLLEPVFKDTYQGLTPFRFKNMVRERIALELDRMELTE